MDETLLIMKAKMSWKQLKEGILNDELPRDRKKYVKFSNLADINKRMVIYYLKLGFKRPQNRASYLKGILEEMLRSSNERYDIEDSGRP
tara:strand:- start:390 stop:656 length:267 start_codon:yes stop_codon:yes gene_type:complete